MALATHVIPSSHLKTQRSRGGATLSKEAGLAEPEPLCSGNRSQGDISTSVSQKASEQTDWKLPRRQRCVRNFSMFQSSQQHTHSCPSAHFQLLAGKGPTSPSLPVHRPLALAPATSLRSLPRVLPHSPPFTTEQPTPFSYTKFMNPPLPHLKPPSEDQSRSSLWFT